MESKRITTAELKAAYTESGFAPETFPGFIAMRKTKTYAAMMAILEQWKRSAAGRKLVLRRTTERLNAGVERE